MNKKITTVIILIIICASSIIVSILYLIKNDIIDINDIYTNADAKNTQVANGSNISSTENSALGSKSCVLLEEGAEYDTMYDDRTSIYVKLNDISISKNKAELPEFDTFEDWDEIKDSQGNITNEYSYVVLNITMMNKGNENVEVSLNSLLLHFGTDGGYNEARSFNSSEKKTSKNYFVEKLEPGKKLNVNVAYVAEDKQLNEYKDCDIALGAARILGYDLIENFQSPFEARTFNDFWRRWHISMTSWFRDYVYFSLGGSRCAPWRHYLNIVIVFVCSGLWHGADWRYLAWGLFTGLLAAFGVMTARARQRINRYNPLYRMGWFKVFWQCLFTNALFCLTLVFFASAIYNTDPFAVYGSLLQGWDGLAGSWAQVSGLIYSSGIDGRLPVVLTCGTAIVLAMEHNGNNVARWIRKQCFVLRWTVYYAAAVSILFFAAFGQSAFIYQQF